MRHTTQGPKKGIHCKCGELASWYKKSKKHRVLVCPRCGIIATNLLPLLALAAPAIMQAVGPMVAEAVGGMMGGKAADSTPGALNLGRRRAEPGSRLQRLIEAEKSLGRG